MEVTPQETVLPPQPQIGIMAEFPTTDTISQRWSDVKLDGDLTYEQLIILMEMAIDGGVTPTGAGTDKTWVYNALMTADPLLRAFTLERRMSSGVTDWDEEIPFSLARAFSLSGAIGENLKFDADIFGRPIDRTAALTAAIPVPSVNFAAAADTKLFIDNTFAGLGATQVLEALASWNMGVRTQVQPKFFQDGRADKSFTNYGLKRFGFDFSAETEMNAIINAERAKAADRSIRYCRLVATGGIITGSAVNYKIQIDFAARYKAGMFDQRGNRDGNNLVPLELMSAYDATNTFIWKATIVNALSTVP